MTKLINFKNWNLDCYSKSITDFITFLKNNILEQVRNCKNNKDYEEYINILNELEEKAYNDDFIKEYFNYGRNINILNGRNVIITSIAEKNKFLKNFRKYIFSQSFNDFYIKNSFIKKEDFESYIEKEVNNSIKRVRFDEVLINKELNLKIYFEYKLRIICFYISNINDINEVEIYKQLQKYSKFIIENISDSNLIELNQENYFYIKIKNLSTNSKIDYGKEEKEISRKIIEYLNKEIIRQIIIDDSFGDFLKTFIPKLK